MSSIRDDIDLLIKVKKKKEEYLLLDTYSYGQLREELGLDFIEPFEKYRGLNIVIDGESKEAKRLISELEYKREYSSGVNF